MSLFFLGRGDAPSAPKKEQLPGFPQTEIEDLVVGFYRIPYISRFGSFNHHLFGP